MTDKPERRTRSPEEKAELLRRFRGPVEEHDAETVEFWRNASSDEHAEAMIQLSQYAERMAAQTGLHKDPELRFPPLKQLREQKLAWEAKRKAELEASGEDDA